MGTPAASDVKLILKTNLGDDVINAFIADAVLITAQCLAVSGLSDAQQTAINKYVAAHLISVSGVNGTSSSGVVTQKALGDASESYAAVPLGKGLRSTMFGQQALLLEPSGCLAKIGLNKPKFSVLT